MHGDAEHKDSWLRPLDCTKTDVKECSNEPGSSACLYVTTSERLKVAEGSTAIRYPEWFALVWAKTAPHYVALIDWEHLMAMPYPPFLEGDSSDCPACHWVLLYDRAAAAVAGYPKDGGAHCDKDFCEITSLTSESDR